MKYWYDLRPDGSVVRVDNPESEEQKFANGLLPGENDMALFPTPPPHNERVQKASIVLTWDKEAGVVREQWVVSNLTDAELAQQQAFRWRGVRARRDAMLSATDFLLLSDAPITAEQKQKVLEYRAALRSLPQRFQEPEDVEFPELNY